MFSDVFSHVVCLFAFIEHILPCRHVLCYLSTKLCLNWPMCVSGKECLWQSILADTRARIRAKKINLK